MYFSLLPLLTPSSPHHSYHLQAIVLSKAELVRNQLRGDVAEADAIATTAKKTLSLQSGDVARMRDQVSQLADRLSGANERMDKDAKYAAPSAYCDGSSLHPLLRPSSPSPPSPSPHCRRTAESRAIVAAMRQECAGRTAQATALTARVERLQSRLRALQDRLAHRK